MALIGKIQPSKGGWIIGASGLLALVVLIAAAASPARALPGDAAAVMAASDLDGDPLDAQAVTEVCTRCHAASQFLGTPRSSGRWEQVFAQMSGFGAGGTEEQLNRVVAYFQMNLMVVNVNTSPAEELGPTLQVSDETVGLIMARRAQRKFTGWKDLATIPGVHHATVQKLSDTGRALY
jgi:hypothetical protein